MNASTLAAGLVMRVAAVTLAACLISSCDRDNSQHTHDELTQLQGEFEQLANQVGRLEFRIYELENHHPSQTAGGDTAAEPDSLPSDNNADSDNMNPEDNGRFDLTPVAP